MPSLNDAAKMAKASASSVEYFGQALSHCCHSTGATAAVVWDVGQAPFRRLSYYSAGDKLIKIPLPETDHIDLLSRAARKTESFSVNVMDDGSVSHSILLFPSSLEDKRLVWEFVFPAEWDRVTKEKHCQSEIRPFVELAWEPKQVDKLSSPISGDSARSPNTTAPTRSPLSQEDISQFTHAIHRNMDPLRSAAELSNEGRRLLDIDRVSVAIRKGNRIRVAAISGQPSVNRRSNLILRLQKLTDLVLKTGQGFHYPDDSSVAGPIERALNDYLSGSPIRGITIEPVFDRELNPDDPQHRQQDRAKLIGAIICESCEIELIDPETRNRLQLLHLHGSSAIRNSVNSRSIFLFPVWHFLGNVRQVLLVRHLSKTIIGALAFVTLILALILIRVPLKINCEGSVMPVIRDQVYAQSEGTIREIYVKPGDHVAPKDQLARLANNDLLLRRQEKAGRQAGLEKVLEALELRRLSQGESDASVEIESIRAQLKSLELELAELDKMIDQLMLRSRIQGQVISWDFVDKLKDRPVTYGNRLFEIAKTDGEWEVILQLPDRKLAHVLRARSKSDVPLKVEFVLASDPGKTYHGTIKEIAETTEVLAEQKQVVRIVAQIDANDLELKHVRSKVYAKIRCGRRSLGYVWGHPVLEFVQSNILFRIW